MYKQGYRRKYTQESGFTIAELVIGFTVFAIVAISLLALYVSLVNSAFIAKQKAVASTLATNQMEYLKGLPYDSLAVAGGSIYSASPLPATQTQTVNGITFTITTSINYIDDAYDGCASYPTQALKQLYCRNYPPPSGAPAVDSNPQDYKVAHVSVSGKSGAKLAEVDTQVSARVSETASTTGAMFVKTIDSTGNPVSGASVTVANNTLAPVVNLSDTTDSNGIAIFYGLPPDSNPDYVITASASGYSSLATIAISGTLQPNYPNQKILNQQSSYVTLTIKPQGTYSLLLETTDVNGAPLSGVKVYVKGGYKKYTATTDTSYYYDNFSPSDTRPTTDAGGLAGITNLVPGNYILCGDDGSINCKIGAVTYYLAAALPYAGANSLNPIAVPTYDSASPPATTFIYGGNPYLQKVRLMLTTNSSFPRVNNFSPDDLSLAAGGLNSVAFTVSGKNLPCSSTPASCSTTVKFVQGSTTYTASCTGASTGLQLNCTVNLTGIAQGTAQLVVSAGGNTLTLPASPQLGGLNVTP